MTGLAVFSILIGAIKMVWERNSQPGRELALSLLQLVIISTVGLAVIALLINVSDKFATWILIDAPRNPNGTYTTFQVAYGAMFNVRLPVLDLSVIEVAPHRLDETSSPRLRLALRYPVLDRELVDLAVLQLIEDRAAPQRPVEIHDGQAEQEVPLLAGPKDTCIEERGEHFSILSEIGR